jgi:hypothetical protein
MHLGRGVMVLAGAQVMAVRDLGMMRGLLVMTGLVMLGGLAVMLGGVVVVVRRTLVMLVDVMVVHILSVHRIAPWLLRCGRGPLTPTMNPLRPAFVSSGRAALPRSQSRHVPSQ